MKGIYLIAIATVFLASLNVIAAEEQEFDEIPTKCPAKDPKNTTIHLAHESDCTKFYMCRAGEKILKQCPKMNEKGDRLHFNPKLQVCDWPSHAGCKTKSSDEDEEIDVQFIEEEEHDGPFLMVEIPTKCPAKDPKNTTIHLAHESDCTKFYMCRAGEKILKQCPKMNKKGDRLHFNPELQVCDWPSHAGCKTKSSDEDEEIDVQFIEEEEHDGPFLMVEIPTKCPAKDPKNTTIHLAHESDCTKFYMCRAGEKILKQCPKMNEKGDRLHFNPELQVCDWPWHAGCKLNKSSIECPPGSDGRLLPHQCNCSLCYECVNGDRILRECPPGWYFSKKYQGCVKFDDSDCEKKPSPKCTREGELIPHGCDCEKYYECRKDDQVLRKCKNGRHFSPERRRCEDPDKAGCDPIKSPPHRGDCPKPVPKNPWRHECDCRLFYKCENGKKRLYECPWEYYFDEKKDRCVREKYVNCKNPWDN